MRLIKDLFLVLFTMAQVACEMPVSIYGWFARKGWEDKDVK